MTFKTTNGHDKYVCYHEFFFEFIEKQFETILASVLIAIINLVATLALDLIGEAEGDRVRTNSSIGRFTRIIIMIFINCAIIPLTISLHDEGFSFHWFFDTGVTLSMTYTIQIVSIHVGKIASALLIFFLRFRDRGWSVDYQKKISILGACFGSCRAKDKNRFD